MLITIFEQIPDQRSPLGRRYELKFILLFTVLAILSGADSYRKVATWIKANKEFLKEHFPIKWHTYPSHTSIGRIIQGVAKDSLEIAFRSEATALAGSESRAVSMDGKTLRGSFDHFKDKKAIQLFSAFFNKPKIILAHEIIVDKKTNEIPMAQKLIADLKLTDRLFTFDAMHCQKKLYS